jgi:hypothetical protein
MPSAVEEAGALLATLVTDVASFTREEWRDPRVRAIRDEFPTWDEVRAAALHAQARMRGLAAPAPPEPAEPPPTARSMPAPGPLPGPTAVPLPHRERAIVMRGGTMVWEDRDLVRVAFARKPRFGSPEARAKEMLKAADFTYTGSDECWSKAANPLTRREALEAVRELGPADVGGGGSTAERGYREAWKNGPPTARPAPALAPSREKEVVRLAFESTGSDDQRVVFYPQGYFVAVSPAFRDALEAEGAVLDDVRELYLADVALAGGCIKRLAAAGFALQIPPDVAEAVRAVHASCARELAGATERANQADAMLNLRGDALKSYQRTGIAWLTSRFCAGKGALLADDPGLGKTAQVLISLPPGARVVVIVNLVGKGSWEKEARKWRPDLRVNMISGHNFRWPEASEIVVANYDILPDPNEAGRPPPAVFLVADEAHLAKNPNAHRTKNLKAMARAVSRSRGAVILATGTPLVNRPPDLLSLLQIADLLEESFGTVAKFAELMGGSKSGKGYSWGKVPDSEAVAKRLRRVMLRRIADDVLPELPEITREDVSVDIDEATRLAVDKALDGLDVEQALRAAKMGNPLALSRISRAREALARAKVPALVELVESAEEAGDPLVVFAAHIVPVSVLAKRPGWALITGATSAEDRTAIVEKFQRGELLGVAGTIGAMGTAITLTRSRHCIFVEEAWNPTENKQAADRIHRLGQRNATLMTVLVANHVLDVRVAQINAEKQERLDASINAAKVTNADVEAPSLPPLTELRIEAETLAGARAALEAERAKSLHPRGGGAGLRL